MSLGVIWWFMDFFNRGVNHERDLFIILNKHWNFYH